jgi:hypothetical protein
MCFDRNIDGNRDDKFLIGIIGQCTDQRNLLYQKILTIRIEIKILKENVE